MPEVVAAAASATIPWWTWLALVVLSGLLVGLIIFTVKASRQRRRRVPSSRNAGAGLSAEQQSFQLEMKLMLERRLYEKQVRRTDSTTGGAADGDSGGDSGGDGRDGGAPNGPDRV